MFRLLFLFVFVIQVSVAQISMSNYTRSSLESLNLAVKNNDFLALEKLSNELPIRKMFGHTVIACVAKLENTFESTNIFIGSEVGGIASLYAKISAISELLNHADITYLQIAQKIAPSIDEAVKDVRADSVHLGIGLDQPYTGKNVMIGITDWGFDYSHPNFYDTLLNNTRIYAVWDHYRTDGAAPANFNYGVEYTSPQDIVAAQADTFNAYGYAYHGSHVAGIAAGSGGGNPALRGVAFESDLLFTTFYHDEASVMDAFAWMKEKADEVNKRLVVNMSWGLYHLGTLDGNSLLGQILENYTNQNVVFVTSGGNNGDVNFHLQYTFNNDEIKSKVEFYPYSANSNMWGQSLTMWGEPTHSFETRFEVKQGVNILGVSPWYSTVTTTNYIDSFLVVNSDTIFYNLTMDNVFPLNQRPHARLRIKNTNTSLSIVMNAKASTGTVHFWNVTELTNDLGNWGMPFSVSGIGTIGGDNQFGIGEPACNETTIAVGAYRSEYTLSNGSIYGGNLASFSSVGPTLDGRIKPDISAPGRSVTSSLNSFSNVNPTVSTTVNFNGIDYPFGSLSGTSMSAPVVSGVVALLLEADPNLTPQQVKDFIQLTARLDDKTGVISAPGSVEWGMGKVNAYHAILGILGLAHVSNEKTSQFKVYPNPSNGRFNIDGLAVAANYKLISLQGKVVQTGSISSEIDCSTLELGTYFLFIDGIEECFKLVLNR
ncbi:MAG: S8 family serine peptidase [Lishizhenia sp.]